MLLKIQSRSLQLCFGSHHQRLETRFNDTVVGVLKSLRCLLPSTITEEVKNNDNASVESSGYLKVLVDFYTKDLATLEIAQHEYCNLYALLNNWDFCEGEAVPRDHEDLLIFLQIFDLKGQFENIFKLLEIVLTLPVSSAHDERAFNFLKRVKTYLRSTMNEERLSNLVFISINREIMASLS